MDWIAILGNVMLFCLVFGMSATVDSKCIQSQIKNHRALLTGLFSQFVALPLIGFIVVAWLFPNLDNAISLMILIVTCSPGGSYSNWFCSMFNADLALSVTMTAISTLMSTVMMPLNLLIYTKLYAKRRKAYDANNNYYYDDDDVNNKNNINPDQDGEIVEKIDFVSLFVALVVVMTAIGIGLCCSWKISSRRFNAYCNQLGNFAGLTLICFSAIMTNVGGADNAQIWERDWDFYAAVATPCVAGLLLAHSLAAMNSLLYPECMTVGIECCYQNVGIATSMAMGMFDGDQLNAAMGVPFLYGSIEALVVGLYCVIMWKLGWSKAPSDAPFCKVLVTSYEVLECVKKDMEQSVEISYSYAEQPLEEVYDLEGNIVWTYFNCAWYNSKNKNNNRKSESLQDKIIAADANCQGTNTNDGDTTCSSTRSR